MTTASRAESGTETSAAVMAQGRGTRKRKINSNTLHDGKLVNDGTVPKPRLFNP